mgnify:FL=1
MPGKNGAMSGLSCFTEHRLRLGNVRINLALCSACAIFNLVSDRLRFGQTQTSLVCRAPCAIFVLP